MADLSWLQTVMITLVVVVTPWALWRVCRRLLRNAKLVADINLEFKDKAVLMQINDKIGWDFRVRKLKTGKTDVAEQKSAPVDLNLTLNDGVTLHT